MMKKYFFSKRKVEMYYSKRDKMIVMPLFAYHIYYAVILLSFLDITQFRGHVITFLKIAIETHLENNRSNFTSIGYSGIHAHM